MKKFNLLLFAVFISASFTQCKKVSPVVDSKNQDVENVSKDLKIAVNATTCSDCVESATKLTTVQATALASQFAPLLKFDRAAKGYPTSVENIWASTSPSSIVCGGTLVLANTSAITTINFPTYYDVTTNPNNSDRVFIDYWWAYKRQENCVASTGGHDYDWEHIVVQVQKSTSKVLTVTYFQHAGWYTKDYRNVTTGTVIPVFVGKIAHGSYHNSRSTSFPGYECTYFGDYRNPNGAKDEFAANTNLVRMNCNNTQLSFNGKWGNSGKGPMFRDRNYWNYKTCKGTDGISGTDGCSQSDFTENTLIGSF